MKNINLTNSQLVENSELAVEIPKDTMEIGVDFLDTHNLLDGKIPWEELREMLPEINEHVRDYAKQGGSIRTELMNAFDAHFGASQHVSEWCSSIVPNLKAYAQLFTDYNAAKAKTQNDLLQNILSDSVLRWTQAQAEMDKMVTNLNAGNETIVTLLGQFEKDSDVKSKTFRKKLKENTKSNRFMDKFNKKKTVKITARLKQRLEEASNMLINVDDLVYLTLYHTKAIVDAMKWCLDTFKEMKSHSEQLNDFESIVGDSRMQDVISKATQNLIDKCSEYTEKHGKTWTN